MTDKIMQLPQNDLDQQLDELLKTVKNAEDATLVELKRTLLAMTNLDDAAMLNISIDKYNFQIPLVIIDLYQNFISYLADCINCLE
jgi:hypothetical protein